jgi:hypothetical protein
MTRWLAFAAASWLLGSSGAQAQMKGFGAIEIAEVAKNRTLDLRIAKPQAGYTTALHLAPGMLVQEDLGSNAALGLGLVSKYEKRRGSGTQPIRPSRKPAVTFTMKF